MKISSLCPRVTLLPNRPCFPINTKHFRRSRSSVPAEPPFPMCPREKRFRFLYPSLLCPHGRFSPPMTARRRRRRWRSKKKNKSSDTGNLPSPDGGLFHFRSCFHRGGATRGLRPSPPYRSPPPPPPPRLSPLVVARATLCSLAKRENVTSNSACHPVPRTNREFLLRSDIIPVAAFHPHGSRRIARFYTPRPG